MCTSSQPEAPDAQEVIDAATQSNEDTAGYQAGLNNVNQVTPGGTLTYSMVPGADGEPDTWTATTALSPELQGIYDSTTGGLQSVADAGATAAAGLSNLNPITTPTYQSYGAGPQLATSIASGGKINGNIADAGAITKSLSTDDYSADRQKAEDALFGELDAQSAKDQATLETSLANKGIQIGSDAYTRAMDDFQKSTSANRTDAILSATDYQKQLQDMELAGANFANDAQAQQFGQNSTVTSTANAAQAQQFGQNKDQADFGNTAKQQEFDNSTNITGLNNALGQQQFQDAINGNSAEINQALGLLGGAQVASPDFSATPTTAVAGTDVAGITNSAYDDAASAYATDQSNIGGIFGTLGTLASTILSLSDRRLKNDVSEIGETHDGQPIYSFKYKGSDKTQIGLMAQDVEKTHPDAVQKIGGIRFVDYSKALEAA